MASYQKVNLATEVALAAASTLSTAVNLSSKAKKMIGTIAASSVHADTTITAKIQHSPDKTLWYDYISFTAIVGAAANNELKLPSATGIDIPILPYVRSSIALTGSTLLASVIIDLWFEN